MQLWQYCLLVTAMLLYMFPTLFASIARSTKNCSNSHWCMHQWLLLQFLVLLMLGAGSVRNMLSDLAVTNKQYCQSCISLVLYV